MAYNVVRDWNKRQILFRTRRGLDVACEWMMSRIDDLDIDNTSADEILDGGELGGSWFIGDLLENNPEGWKRDDGSIVIGKRMDNGKWYIKKINDWKQWIADVYHCSDCWGQKVTDDEMLMELNETMEQKDPGDYSPDPSLYKECAAYWNKLCDAYPE